jgi:predicted SnoaL-like aldol condensation-catalyzing enzyme
MTFRQRTIGYVAAAAVAAISTVPYAVADGTGNDGPPRTGEQAAISQRLRNKETVVKFYNEALNNKQPDEALKYVGNDYKQHNPMVEDGKDGFRKFINWIRSDHPESHSEIKQVFADGDYVLLNVHMVRHPGERGLAIGEIFRLEDGKIVEHWDRIQPIPETAKNSNTMF